MLVRRRSIFECVPSEWKRKKSFVGVVVDVVVVRKICPTKKATTFHQSQLRGSVFDEGSLRKFACPIIKFFSCSGVLFGGEEGAIRAAMIVVIETKTTEECA